MRRTHLRGHTNILKRLLTHAGGFNLGLAMRHLMGIGTPRGLQGRLAAAMAGLIALWTLIEDRWASGARHGNIHCDHSRRISDMSCYQPSLENGISTTGC
jgi:hypothetical protein